ncbi:MAG TPA: penicillin-binding transpeptidase domain-containing protein [Ruminococcus flavefaciens]|nr:penicillin-binding transpeptidase domain-containing protein [Ruminococcus flavefaciens]
MRSIFRYTSFLLAVTFIASAVSCSSSASPSEPEPQNTEVTTAAVTEEETTEEAVPAMAVTGGIVKGNFYDANGKLLVSSEVQDDGSVKRVYEKEYAVPFANIITEMSAGYDTTFDEVLMTENPVSADSSYAYPVGQSIQLTLDADKQKAIYEYMDEKKIKGSCVVLRSDGSILSQVSYPAYDPTTVKDQKYDEDLAWGEVGNKAFQNYEPGSCFKIMSEVIADKHGIYEQWDEGEWDFGGTPIVNWDHETNKNSYPMSRSLYWAFVSSSNIFFAKTFDQIGVDGVLDDLETMFHFGAECDIPCDFGDIENNVEIYCDDDLRRTAFGQSYVLTCPIYLAALGREAVFGDMVRPFVFKNIVDTNDGKTVIGEGSKSGDVIASIPEAYRQGLKDGMIGVASETGIYPPEGYTLYAKTGTAETWFDDDFLYITGAIVNEKDDPKASYTDYSNYGEKGSYSIVLQVQNPSELGYSFAIHASALYGDIINILLK